MGKQTGKKDGTFHADASQRVVVLHGKELYLLREHLASIRATMEEAYGEVEVFNFDGTSAEPAEVLDECRSFALLTAAKLVVVDKAEEFVKKDRRPPVERYAANPTDRTTLVLRSESWRKGNLDKIIVKNGGALVKCEPPTTATAIKFAHRRCSKRYDAELDRQAGVQLVELTGNDLSRIDSELAKLALAAGPGGTITTSLVSELIGLSREEKAWQVQEPLLSADAQRSLTKLRELLSVSRLAETQIGYSFTDLARKMTLVAAAERQGEYMSEVYRDLMLNYGGRGRRISEVTARIGLKGCETLFARAIDADARSKSGFGAQARALERLTFEFCDKIA